jgi:XTP/dITP diphosphohydrolase
LGFITKDKGQMTNEDFQLLVATTNAGKIRELEGLLTDLPLTLRGLREFPNAVEVEETGKTFAENAILKAEGYAKQLKILSLADDSGLEVEAMGGAPGVYSARFAGENTSYEKKIETLLNKIGQADNRRARFVCVMAIANENGKIKYLAEGVCQGRIAFEPRGENGFGYDPVFIPDGFEQTLGELPGEIKREISHRARACKKIIQYLRDFYGVSVD